MCRCPHGVVRSLRRTPRGGGGPGAARPTRLPFFSQNCPRFPLIRNRYTPLHKALNFPRVRMRPHCVCGRRSHYISSRQQSATQCAVWALATGRPRAKWTHRYKMTRITSSHRRVLRARERRPRHRMPMARANGVRPLALVLRPSEHPPRCNNARSRRSMHTYVMCGSASGRAVLPTARGW